MMDAYYQPKSGFNWADDEEDDFDFESFRACTHNAAPTLEELGPLQKTSITEDFAPLPALSSEEPTDDAALRQPFDTTTTCLRRLPGDHALYLSSFSEDWPFQQPFPATYFYHANYHCALPAYPGLSSVVGRRDSYASNWRDVKVRAGGFRLQRGGTFMMKNTRMSYELAVQGEEEVPELEEGETSEEEVEEELGGALTPPDVLSGDELVKESDVAFGVENQVAIADGEESDDSDTTLIDVMSRSTIIDNEKCSDAGFVTTSSSSHATSPDPRETPPPTPIWSVSGMLALGTGIAVGAVIGAVFFRRR